MKRISRTILVPHDLSRNATRALELAAALAGPKGRLTVLHVANEYGNVLHQRAVVEKARRTLERLIARAAPRRGRPTIECRVDVGVAHRQINKAARHAD